VDLPGYGFANVARKEKTQFNRSVANYLKDRPNLCCVFALLDSGLPPQPIDLEFVEWLASNTVPFVLVFNKTDRVSAATVQANIKAFTDRISSWSVNLPEVFTCSARTKQGRKELLGMIEEAMIAVEAEAPAESGPMSSDVEMPPEDTSAATSRKSKAQETRANRPHPTRPW